MNVFKRLVGSLLMAGVIISSTPSTAHAMAGCPEDLSSVTITAPNLAGRYGDGEFIKQENGSTMWTGGINSGIFTGEAHKVSSGFWGDTYEFTARDIHSGAEITGTFTLSSFNCFIVDNGLSERYHTKDVYVKSFRQTSLVQ